MPASTVEQPTLCHLSQNLPASGSSMHCANTGLGAQYVHGSAGVRTSQGEPSCGADGGQPAASKVTAPSSGNSHTQEPVPQPGRQAQQYTDVWQAGVASGTHGSPKSDVISSQAGVAASSSAPTSARTASSRQLEPAETPSPPANRSEAVMPQARARPADSGAGNTTSPRMIPHRMAPQPCVFNPQCCPPHPARVCVSSRTCLQRVRLADLCRRSVA